MNKYKIWAVAWLVFVVSLMVIIGGLTGAIDPFFHYHAPLEQLEYPINNQRYQNHGIVRHFDYDALITGTSMTENFRTSELDALFGVNSIKVSFSGATFPELNDNLRTALEANPNVKMVLYAMDSWFLHAARGEMRTDAEFPTYLYDDNVFNDVKYLLNKDILFSDTLEVLMFTRRGEQTTSFDEYSSWRWFTFSWEETLKNYPRPEITQEQKQLTQEEIDLITYNMVEQTVALAREYPDVTFYYFFPPYSALYWDEVSRNGKLDYTMDSLKLATGLLLQAENIRLYSFLDDYEVVTDLNNYRDTVHHRSEVNSRVLEKISADAHRLTEENYEAYWESLRAYYQAFDFASLFPEA